MSWTITPQTKVPVDPYRSQVSLLLHGDGANGSTTITDSSPTPKTVTAVGNAQISTAVNNPFGQSTGVIYFDNAGDWLTIASGAGIAFPADFTCEMWVYRLDTGTDFLLDSRSSEATGNFYIAANPAFAVANATRISYQSALATGQWYHLAVCRSVGVCSMYINGAPSTSSYTDSTSFPGGSAGLRIGSSYTNGNAFNGYLYDVRITQVARYTSSFIPPTAPFPDI